MSEGAKESMEMPKHGTLCWTEIASNNLEATRSFYTELFGWEVKDSGNDVGMQYLEYDTGAGHPSGGMYEMSKEMFGDQIPPPHFMNYIAVDDVDETVAKLVELGGSTLGEPADIPNTGRMCMVQDPTGATFAVITLKSA